MTASAITAAGTYRLGDRDVHRMGYGAMQLAGPHVFGPPRDRAAAIAVLREAIELGIDHIDTSDFYGPHVTNQIIREALHPYRDDLTIVTKVGARRDDAGAWLPAQSAAELESAIHDNLRNLGLDVIDVVNFRAMGTGEGGVEPTVASIEPQLTVLAGLQEKGLIRHIGISTVTEVQLAEAKSLIRVACVQNLYNCAHREDEAMIDALAADGIAYVPYFPLGGFSPLQAGQLDAVADELGATPMQVALAWLLHRAPNILLIPGTSSVAHLRENVAAAEVDLSEAQLATLDGIAGG